MFYESDLAFRGPKLALSWPKLAQSWPKLAQVGPKLAQVGAKLAQVRLLARRKWSLAALGRLLGGPGWVPRRRTHEGTREPVRFFCIDIVVLF